MAKHAHDRTLVLHIGLHKTATSFVQNLLSSRRYDLLDDGVLYPLAGSGSLSRGVDRLQTATRDGAQSGHSLLTEVGDRREVVRAVLDELPDSASTVLLSSEDFSLGRLPARKYLERLDTFGTIKVVAVVRRQDQWIESVYKQLVDQYGRFETRSLEAYLADVGPKMLDFHARLEPWREFVGPENFHVLSYDDLAGGAEICARILDVAGVSPELRDDVAAGQAPRYDSVRAIDTVGLRMLNACRLPERDLRVQAAKRIYAEAPEGDIVLMPAAARQAIIERCAPINERIESEWFSEPVPGFRFGAEIAEQPDQTISGPEVLDYIDRVLRHCDHARGETEGDSA